MIVRAQDVGFGFTKFCKGKTSVSNYQCSMFPSFTPLATPHFMDNSGMNSKDTVMIKVDECTYEIGPDCELSTKIHDARVLHRDFSISAPYLALNLGALHYLKQPVIDLLVVGLPVNIMKDKKEQLKSLLTGTHETANGFTVKVNEVLPLAQPLGGYYYHAMHNGYMLKKRNNLTLIIDPGFFTLDWVVAKNIKPIESRSGSHEGGMSAVLTSIARSLSESRKITYDNLSAIDTGLRTGKFKIASNPVDLKEHIPAAKHYMERSLSVLHNTVGDGNDIDEIVVIGGGANLFAPSIQKHFPEHQIIMCKDSIYSNVKGFQLVGESIMAKRSNLVA